MSWKRTVALLVLFVFISFIAMVIVHEGTHVILNGGRVDGICILNCNPMEEGGMLGNHYTPFGVYLTEPVNPLAKDENIAGFAGVIGFAVCLFLLIGLFLRH